MLGGAYWTQRSVLTVDGLSTPAGLRAVSQLVLSVTWSINDIPSTCQLNLTILGISNTVLECTGCATFCALCPQSSYLRLNYWRFYRKYCRMPKQALLKSFVIIVWRSLNPWTVERVCLILGSLQFSQIPLWSFMFLNTVKLVISNNFWRQLTFIICTMEYIHK